MPAWLSLSLPREPPYTPNFGYKRKLFRPSMKNGVVKQRYQGETMSWPRQYETGHKPPLCEKWAWDFAHTAPTLSGATFFNPRRALDSWRSQLSARVDNVVSVPENQGTG